MTRPADRHGTEQHGPEQHGPERQGGPGRQTRLLVRVVVLALTGMLLYHVGVGAHAATVHGVALLNGSSFQPQQQRELRERRLYEYVRDEVGRRVAPGTRMMIVSSDEKWTQRLTEFAAIHRIDLVADRTRAEVTARVVADRSGPVGVRLVVEQVR